MNDEGRPGNRSVETAGYLAGAGFGADSDVWEYTDSSDDPESEEAGSFSPGSVRFSNPAAEFRPTRDFSVGSSDFSAESGFSADSTLSADSGFSADSEFPAEPEPAAGREDAFEPDASFEPDDSAEPQDSSEPDASAEPQDSAEPDASAEPAVFDVFSRPSFFGEPDFSGESEPPAEPDASAEPDAAAEPQDSAEPASAEPAITDVFSRPSFFSEPDFSGESEPPAEPDASAEPDAAAEPQDSAESASAEPAVPDVFSRPSFFNEPDSTAEPEPAAVPESPAEPEVSAEPEMSAEQNGGRPDGPDAFTRPGYPARPDFSSDFFTRPTFFAGSEVREETKPPEQPRYPTPGESRYSAQDEPRYSALNEPRRSLSEEPRYTALDEPRRTFNGEPRYSAPGESRYSALDEPRRATPDEPRQSLSEESRRSLPGETRYPMPGDAPRSFREAPSFTPTPAENEAGKTGDPATAETPEPAVIVEVNGKPAAQHPVRATGELSVLRPPERAVGLDTRLPDALWAYDNYPVAENVPPADDQAGVVSLGYIGAAVKRKKKIWLATTAIGVLIAAGLFTTYHPKYTDTTTVLLALDPSLDAATAIQTDAILAVDSNMAQLSMQKLGVHETVPQFLKTYNVTVSTTTNDLLTFTATAPTATAAYNEANTLATTFLQYRAQTELEKESANTAAQDKQVAQTEQTVSSLNSQVRRLKANGAGSGDSRLTRLQTDLVNAQTLLTSLQQNVASTESTQRSTTAGLIANSSVLDTGIPAKGISQKKFAIEYGGGAIFGGLVLGLLIAAISAIVSDRLRRRDDVAAAIGAPVRVSVASGGKRSRKAAQEADLKRVAAHLRGAVPSGSDGAGSLAIVAVDDKKFVSEAIREMAVTAGREGKRVVLVDLADGALGALFGTKEPGIRGVDVSGVRVVLVTPERGDLAPVGPLHEPMLGTPIDGITNVHAAADLFITLATVKPATGAAHLKTWADDAVAVVTAGKSSVAKVQAVGEMIRFADARLDSAILLGADEKDESLGFVTA